MKPILIAVAGGIGALARYGLGVALAKSPTGWLQGLLGTWAANLIGCFLMGVLLATPDARIIPEVRTILAVGFLGGLTTYSAFNADAMALFPSLRGWLYLAGMLTTCALAGWLGSATGRAVWSS